MSSIRSRLFLPILKHFIQPRFGADVPLEKQRITLENMSKSVKLPKQASLEALKIGYLSVEFIRTIDQVDDKATVLHLHGGGYTMGSCNTHRDLTAYVAINGQCQGLLVDYRLAPEYPFPAALEDAMTAYNWLLQQDILPQQISLVGDSAGAGLAIALCFILKEKNIPLPSSVACISPWVDLAFKGETLVTREHVEYATNLGNLQNSADCYISQDNPYNPLISPLYGDLRGLPPLLIHAGDHEILLSDATRLAERAKEAGVEVELKIWENMWHVWHFFAPYLPESNIAVAEIGKFIRHHFDKQKSVVN